MKLIPELQEIFISHLNSNYNNLYNAITEEMIIDLNNKIKDLKLYDFVIEKIAQKSKNQLDLKLYHPALNFSIQAKFKE
ncbi:MAG: hypothetical protein Q8869_00845, partial [Candidatus Phytoplasma australasiaticum]|nr:hypothetical protein [Candidatus Phytoplasma australasiaticum]